jgi:NADH-quinone oxidoreductase subunit N
MYYYLRVISTMFMEKEVVAPATPVPAAPVPATKRVSTKAGNRDAMVSPGSATALAVKPTSKVAGQARTMVAAQKTTEKEPALNIGLMSWTAITIAFIGTLAMGTVLPFWLVNLAQQAAQAMLR